MSKWCYFVLAILLIYVHCHDAEEGEFQVTVVTPDKEPVAGAYIEGGNDWTYFHSITDSNGIAVLPGYALGQSAVLGKTNYIPLEIDTIQPDEYILTPTEKQFHLIGDMEGDAFRFRGDTVFTISYQGIYSVYRFNDNSVTLCATAELPYQVKSIKLYGGILWYSTHENGIYVYSLDNPVQPQQICHLDISGYLRHFAVKDSIIAAAPSSGLGEIRFFTFSYDGTFNEHMSIGNFCIDHMLFKAGYLVVIGYDFNLPAVFDVSDPSHPMLVYNGISSGYYTGIPYEDYIILVPPYDNPYPEFQCKLLNISDPTAPIMEGTFNADAWLMHMYENGNALAQIALWSFALLEGSFDDGYRIVAVINEYDLGNFYRYGTSHHPYYNIGGRLWKLE